MVGHAGELLDAAGDTAGATRLIEAELPRAEAPNYYMTYLANFAEARKDKQGAVGWARRAWQSARGPASRLQWAVMYAATVLRVTPEDRAAVAAAGNAVVDAIAADPGGYAGNGRRMVDGWATRLRAWAATHGGADVIAALDRSMRSVCVTSGDGAAERCRLHLSPV